MRFRHFLPLALLFFAVGCKPSVDEGIELPTSPTASFDWEYLYVDTAATPYTDSNRVVFTYQAEEGFLHFWDFDNGLTSNEVTDTTFYPQAGDYEVSYSVYSAGGSGVATAMIPIANTVESVSYTHLTLPTILLV